MLCYLVVTKLLRLCHYTRLYFVVGIENTYVARYPIIAIAEPSVRVLTAFRYYRNANTILIELEFCILLVSFHISISISLSHTQILSLSLSLSISSLALLVYHISLAVSLFHGYFQSIFH